MKYLFFSYLTNIKLADFIDPLDRSLRIENYPALYLNSGKLLAIGGFWDGKLSILSVDQDAVTESYSNHNDTVTIIVADSKENFLISGIQISFRLSP